MRRDKTCMQSMHSQARNLRRIQERHTLPTSGEGSGSCHNTATYSSPRE